MGLKLKLKLKRKSGILGKSVRVTINSENTVKHDQHKGPTTVINTETFHLFRLSQNSDEPGTADQRGA